MKKYKNLKIGIIGCGYWGTNIIKVLEELDLKNIYLFDNNKEQIKHIKKNFFFVNICKTLSEIINLNLNCYFLITPSSTHYKIASKIISSGKNLFIEKPVGNSSRNIKKLIHISKKKQTILMSGYIYNYNIYLKYIKKIIKQNALGKIKYMYFERSNLGPIRNDVSCLWDLAAHDISSCIFLLNKKIKVIGSKCYDFLKKRVFDISTIYLECDGASIEIKSSWLSPNKNRKIIIIGEKKMLLFNELNTNDKIRIYNQYAKYPKIDKFNKSFFTPKANIFVGKSFSPKINFKSPLKDEILYFLNCVSEKKKPATDGDYAYKVSKIIEKIQAKTI